MFNKNDLKITNIALNDDARPILGAILIKKVEIGRGWGVRLVATDGYKLVEKTKSVAEEPQFEEMLVPATTMADVAKMMKASDFLEIDGTKFVIKDKNLIPMRSVDIGRQVEGNYPEYVNLIPDKAAETARLTLNRKLLIKVLETFTRDHIEISVPLKDFRVDGLAPIRIDCADEPFNDTMGVVMPLKR